MKGNVDGWLLFPSLHFTSLPFPSPLGNNISHFLPDIFQGLGLFFNYIYIIKEI